MDQSASVSGISRFTGIHRTDEPPLEVDPNVGDEPSFTFITHGDDLQTKRIRDVSARKQIRSHVMRDVRRRERILGLRRPSKKERIAKDGRSLSVSDSSQFPSPKTPAKITDDGNMTGNGLCTSPTPFDDEGIGHSDMPNATLGRSPASTLEPVSRKRERDPKDEDCQGGRPGIQGHRLAINPGTQLVDPFATLPESPCPPHLVTELIKHCTDVLLPMTLPVENKSPSQVNNRIQHLMQSQIDDKATFYAAMAMSAAHRAVIQIKEAAHVHLERWPTSTDYTIMNDLAIGEVKRKIRDSKTALEARTFTTVTLLVGAALLLGDFGEAALHLGALINMAKMRGGVVDFGGDSSSLPFTVFVSDTKAAAAMGSRPQLQFTSPCGQLDQALLRRIAPPHGSALYMFARSFSTLGILTPTLIELLEGIRDLCFLDEFNFRSEQGLTWEEHDVLRKRMLTIEHALLDYVYETFLPLPEDPATPDIPVLEAVARLSALSYLSTLVIVVLPSSGLGRALTYQMYRLLATVKVRLSNFSPNCLDLLAWSACISIQTCLGHREGSSFHEHLHHLLRLRKYRDWEEFEITMRGYLYNPRVQKTLWHEIFTAAYTGSARPSPVS